MNWLNLQTSMLHAPEYIGADPVARATWMNLLLWCAAQENGGRIAGAGAWPDRRWQQTAGVTLEEVRCAAPLVALEGSDFVIWGYPLDKERTVQAQRTVAQCNGRLGGRKPNLEPSLVVLSEPSLESGKEGKGKEGKRKTEALARWAPPTLTDWLAYAVTLTWPAADAQAAYDHYLACGWRMGSKPVRDWQAAARNCHRRGKTTNINGNHRHSLNGSNSRAFLPRQAPAPAPLPEHAFVPAWAPQLDAYEPSLVRAAVACARFVADVARGATPYWLTLSGETGSGKTMLMQQTFAAAAAHNHRGRAPIYERRRQDPDDRRPLSVWLDSATFARRLLESREFDLPEYVARDFLVAFDDLGAARDKTDFLADALYRLCNQRLGRWSLFTTNFTLDEISERLDDRIASRLIRDRNVGLRITAGDYALRKTAGA